MVKRVIWNLSTLILVVAVLGFGLDRLLSINDFKDCKISKTENGSKASESCRKADAVVVISGGDTGARTRYAASLVEAELAPILITSGDSAQPGVISNAEEMRDIAVSEFRISKTAVLMDKEARNTNENAKNVSQIVQEFNEKNKYSTISSIILVTSGYHQARAYQQFRSKFPVEFQIYNAPVVKDKDWSETWFLSPRGWYLAIKEAIGVVIAPRG